MVIAASHAYARTDFPPAGVSLSGRVVDSTTGGPVAGATVLLRDLKRGAVSRRDGSFTIDDLPAGSYTLVTSCVGYREVRRAVTLAGDMALTLALAPEAVTLAGVTVTGSAGRGGLTGSSQSTTQISGAELERTRGQTLGESLKDIAGVTLLQTGPSIAKPVIRGLHSERVLVINSGVQQEGQQWGAEHGPEIDPFAASRIEVLRGAAGVEFGAGAIGGVIRVQPRELPALPGLDGELTLNGFSNNMQGSGALLLEGSTSALPGFGIRLQGSARKAGDARTPDYVIGNSGFEELNGSATIGYTGQSFGASLYASHFGTRLGIFRGSHVESANDLRSAIERGRPLVDYQFGYTIKPPYQDISHNLLSLSAHAALGGLGRLELQYGYQQNHRQEFDVHNYRYLGDTSGDQAAQRPALDLTLTTYSLGVKLRHNPIAGIAGTIGIEGTRQGNVSDGKFHLIPQFRSYSGGVYLIENYQSGDWIFNAGTRLDYHTTHVYPFLSKRIADTTLPYANLTGALGAVYQFAPAWSVGMNIGTAWRPPGVNELYSDGVHHGTAQYEIGDLGLGRERSYNIDATLRHIGERSRAELSVYNNYIDGFIYLLPDPSPTVTIRGTYPTFRYRQANAMLRGIDGTFEYQLLDRLRLGATLSIVRGDNLDADEPLISMPADRLRLNGHLDLPSAAGLLDAPYLESSATLVRRQDRYPEGVDYADPPAGYALVDISAGARLTLFAQPIDLSLSVQNLFDTSYRDYLSRFRYFSDDPGRNIVLRITMPFGGFTPE